MPTTLPDPPMQRAMALAWESVCAGSLGIGAVVTDQSGAVVSTGRNRLFESDPGDDVLAGTSLAHAETNALAKLRWGAHRDEHLILWTTLQPCIQCLGAIRLSAIDEVRILAPDPLFRGIEEVRHVNEFLDRNWPLITQDVVDEWSVLSLLFPTHAAAFWGAWVPGWVETVPALSALAAEMAASGELTSLAADAVDIDVLASKLWDRLTACVGELRALAGQAQPPA